MTETCTTLETEIEQLCQSAGLTVEAVAISAGRLIASIRHPGRPSRKVLRTLNERLHEARIDQYAIDFHPGEEYDEIVFVEGPELYCCNSTCGHRLQTRFQPGFGLFVDDWLVECTNLDCDLWMQTISSARYPYADLEQRLHFGRERQAEREQRRLEPAAG